jgi:hypothetical protein
LSLIYKNRQESQFTVADLATLGGIWDNSAVECKAALKIDPPSASNIDPSEKCKKVSFCA